MYTSLGYFNIMKVFGLMWVIGGALTRLSLKRVK